jgi:hypothetical protein
MQLTSSGPTQQAYARFAGLMYLVVLATYIAGLLLSGAVVGGGTFDERSQRILASEGLYRLSLVLSLGGTLTTVLLAIGLYGALHPVNGNLAVTGLAFRICESAIGAMGMALSFVSLHLTLATRDSGAFAAEELAALARMISSAPSGDIAAIFFSFGSTVFFYAFLRSTLIPKALSLLGVFASIVFAAFYAARLLAPAESAAFLAYGLGPMLISELATGFWLLLKGIHLAPAAGRAS